MTHEMIGMFEENMKIGNLQQSIHMTAGSIIFIIYLSDAWCLFVEYYVNHIESIQATLDDVISQNQTIFGTIYGAASGDRI